jgi:hypothetical protein
MSTPINAQVAYCIWRLEMWSLNYGSYNEIDRDVDARILTVGVIPDDLREKEARRRKEAGRE